MFGLCYFVFIVAFFGNTIKWATGNNDTLTPALTSETTTSHSLPTSNLNTSAVEGSYTSIDASPTSTVLVAEATLYSSANSQRTVDGFSSAFQTSVSSITTNTFTSINALQATYNNFTPSSSSAIARMSSQFEITASSIHSSFIDTNSIVANLITTSLFDSYSTEPFTRKTDSSTTGAVSMETSYLKSPSPDVTFSTSTGMSSVTTYTNTILANVSKEKSNTEEKDAVITLSTKAVVGIGVAFGFLVLTNFIFIFVICKRSFQVGDRPSYWHTKFDSTLDLTSGLESNPPSLSPSLQTDTQFHNATYCETVEHQEHLSTITEESKNVAAQQPDNFVTQIHNSDYDMCPPPKPERANGYETDVQTETAPPLRLSRHSSDDRLDKSAHSSSADLSGNGLPLGDKCLGFGSSFSNPAYCETEEHITTLP